jgi:signal transduction histidine kinase
VFLPAALGYLPAYGIGIYPFGYLSGVGFVIILAYAILKYRLMDIRVAIKRSTIFSAVVITITAAYAMAAFLLGWVFFGGVYTFKAQIITGLIVALLVAFGFRPLYEWLKETTDTFLFKGEYRPQELMADISDVLSRTLDLNVVISTLKEKIGRALRIEKMELVILEEEELWEDQTLRRARGAKEKKEALKKLINYFKKEREVLVLEELKRKYLEKTKYDKSFLLIKELEKLKAALVIPLLVKQKLVGLFLLQAKKSGDMFTNEDIKLLETIAAQAAIAIENARLYEEMKDFSKTLQKEVARQTRELREANIRLQQLDKAKSEFISLASHQLRTPLSIIKGYISMILENTWGSVIGKQREQLEKVYASNERLIKLVEDLLTVSRIESGRLEFSLQLIDLSSLTENVVNEFSQVAAKKGLYLKYIKPEKPLPRIKVDSLKIRQVIQNLIDNALHYTKKGGATIRLKKEKDKIVFSIQDTGIGISPKEQMTLFEKFSRGKDVGRMHTEGTGLGLYLAAKLVEAHGGKIWVESEGKGKGSAFYFELPIKNKRLAKLSS